ncbi:3-phosphoshikimate 1-carboxyvinyltransferase [hydrothermal vent metagenome]|uniref:3-phosphoshikimate 1-carboxyvinyltransferase n=1 Tax=hydrothermal vent metagenome TaxID=652676 RepID=A0A3B0VK18_9ZZZZ
MQNNPMKTPSITIKKSKGLGGSITVPGDKSISHRAVIFGAIAEGITEVTGFLPGADNLSTIAAFRAMGVTITEDSPTELTIEGVGLHGLKKPADVIDAGNSGTTARLLIGLLAAQNFTSVITGDASLQKRPMMRVVEPLRQMGARIDGKDGGKLLPLTIKGGKLKAIDYESPVASAQLKSCILIAGLYAEGTTTVTEPMKSRDHTENMLKTFGVDVETDETKNYIGYAHNLGAKNKVTLGKNRTLNGTAIKVPGDISSAAFFMVAATIIKTSKLTINYVGANYTRSGVTYILEGMGAKFSTLYTQTAQENTMDITVSASALKGIDIDGALLLLAIDEFPIICVAAAFADGVTRITGAGELRVKESDRIAAMANALTAVGVNVEETEDGIIIHGSADEDGLIKGGTIDSLGDHRIAMAMAVAGLASREGVTIKDPECVDVSYPDFFKVLGEVSQS